MTRFLHVRDSNATQAEGWHARATTRRMRNADKPVFEKMSTHNLI